MASGDKEVVGLRDLAQVRRAPFGVRSQAGPEPIDASGLQRGNQIGRKANEFRNRFSGVPFVEASQLFGGADQDFSIGARNNLPRADFDDAA